MGSAVQQQNIESALPGVEQESVRSYRFNDTDRNDTLCAVLIWTILITELFKNGAKRYARKIIKLLPCKNIDVETIQNRLKSSTSCSEHVRENCSEIHENEGFWNQK